jgi:hypothetical protein
MIAEGLSAMTQLKRLVLPRSSNHLYTFLMITIRRLDFYMLHGMKENMVKEHWPLLERIECGQEMYRRR